MKINILKYKALVLTLILLSGSFYSCDESSVVDNCIKRWILSNFQNVTISFDGGDMAMASSSLTFGTPTTIQYNDTIQGDFEIIIDYESFFYAPPGLGFFVSLTANVLEPSNPNNYMTTGIGTVTPITSNNGTTQIFAAVDSSGNAPNTSNGQYVQIGANSSGQFRIRRSGTSIEVISISGTFVAQRTLNAFYTAPVVFAILYGSNFPNTPQYSSSVRITSFRYLQGSTLVDNDIFDCNSLQ